MQVDIHADVVPSISAAGFHIGMRLHELSSMLIGARIEVFRPRFDLNEAINSNIGFLRINDYVEKGKTAIFYKHDLIRLQFNAESELYCIFVFEGYKGKFENKLGIGSHLCEAVAFNSLYYDDGDEMHYFEDSSGELIPGLAFSAEEASLVDAPDQIINGFCIHDWRKQ